MRRRLVLFALGWFCACTAIAADVLLVQGTLSAPDEAERNYARRLTEACHRWLSELHVPHRVVTDDLLSPSILADTGIALLVYNPYPPKREIDLLEDFVARGGKLLVFYAAEPRLAELMHMRLGEYQIAQRVGAWSAFTFVGDGPAGLPKRVVQTSRNIRPVYPVEGQSKILAKWEDSAGTLTGDPAWVSSDRGCWMTHVLLDDGDSWSKKRMLLALLGAYDPGLRRIATQKLLSQAGTLGKYKDLQDADRHMMKLAAGTPSESEVSRLLSGARRTYLQAAAALDKEKYTEVLDHVRMLDRMLVGAYCRLMVPRQPPVVGVWNHSGQGLYPGDWSRTCAFLESHQVTDLFPNVVNPSQAHYRSSVVPESYVYRTLGDQLGQCIEAAHQRGIKVHAWKVCWRLDRPSEALLSSLKQSGKLQVTRSGTTIPWLCPSVPENRVSEKNAIREIVKTHAIDGIHLDYIRFADSRVCYCKTCRKEFEKHIGRPLAHWPDVAGDKKWKDTFTEWRAGQITSFVRDVSVLVEKHRAGTQLSAAVYGRYPLCVASVGQDWGTWLKKEYVDFVCPMNYTTEADRFAQWTAGQLALAGADGRIYPGIGVTATESRLTPVQVADQVAALVEQGAAGYILFDLNRKTEMETLPALRRTPAPQHLE